MSHLTSKHNLFFVVICFLSFMTSFAIGHRISARHVEFRGLHGRMLIANAIYLENQLVNEDVASRTEFDRNLAVPWLISLLDEIEKVGIDKVAGCCSDSETQDLFVKAIDRAKQLRQNVNKLP